MIPAAPPGGAVQLVDDPPDGFVKAPQPDRAEIHIPESIIDFLQANLEFGEEVADVHPRMVPPNAPVPTDQPALVVARIREGRQGCGLRARRGGVAAGGRGIVQRFVRPDRVGLAAEGVKAARLGGRVGRRRARGGGFQGPVHAFVAPVLFRMRGLDEFGPDAEPNPPDR